MPKPAPKAEIIIDMRRRRVLIAVSIVLWLISVIMILALTGQAGAMGQMLSGWLHTQAGSLAGIIPLYTASLGAWSFKHRSEGASVSIPAGATLMSASLLGIAGLPPFVSGGKIGAMIGNPINNSIGPLLGWSVCMAVFGAGLWIIAPGLARIIVNALAIVSEGIGKVLTSIWTMILGQITRTKTDNDEDEDYVEDEEDEVAEEDDETEEVPQKAVRSAADGITVREKRAEPAAEKPKAEAPYVPMPSIYLPPSLKLLSQTSGKRSVGDVKENAMIIKRTLEDFGIDVEMDEVSIGPSVTRYSLRPAQGLKLARIAALKNELSLALAVHPIRIEAPIPGQSLVGIEIPNRTMSTVGLGTLLSDNEFQDARKPLTIALGEGISGAYHYMDLAKSPHLLIAGATGSGKSVTAHNMILSLLYRNGPDRVRMILVDPKRVELTLYNDIPHLLTPVIKDAKKAIMALRWAAKEMERRYDVLESYKIRDIQSYHTNIVEPAYAAFAKLKNPTEDAEAALPERMPYIVFLIDELADIMQAYPRELESGIVRLAQMSRAIGIHLIISTQRPSVNVITGLIKANIPSRLALKVTSQIDSRTILDAAGAETLLGRGDMLYRGGESGKPERIQCANVGEDEVKAIVTDIIRKNRGDSPDQIELGSSMHEDNAVSYGSFEGKAEEPDDDMYEEAKQLVLESKVASTSFIQRKLRVGYSRAARLVDMLEQNGIVGPANGSKAREILSQGTEVTSEESYDADDITAEEPDQDDL